MIAIKVIYFNSKNFGSFSKQYTVFVNYVRFYEQTAIMLDNSIGPYNKDVMRFLWGAN